MTRIESTNPPRRFRRTVLAAALIALCGLGAYSNSFTDLFLGLDGKESIRDNPHILHVWPLSEALSMPMWPSPDDLEQLRKTTPRPDFHLSQAFDKDALSVSRRAHNSLDETPTVVLRPTFSLSLALTNRLLGSEPQAHHAVNLAIHILAALVLFGIVRRTLARQRFQAFSERRSANVALAAALIWLVHPLQTESVTYIVQRAESLMGLLLLSTVYCAMRAVGSPYRFWWQLAAVAACILGTGSKQTAIFTPLLVWLYDYTFASQLESKWSRPIFYPLLVCPLWVFLLTHGSALNTRFEPLRYLSYAFAQPAVVLHYLKLTVWPSDLFLYVNTELFKVQSVAQVVIPTAILVTVFVATGYCIVKRHWLGFIGGWFFITLGPTSSFFDAVDLIQEHRMYVPLVALAALAAIGGEWAIRGATTRLSKRRRAAVQATVLAVVVLALGARTWIRNLDYHHEFTAVHPADLHGNMTIIADHYLTKDGLLQTEAVRARATLDSPDRDNHDVAFAYFVIGLAHARAGELDRAAVALRRTLRLEPEYAYAHHQLGSVLRDLDDLPGATEHFREAVRIRPTLVYSHKELAVVLSMAGDTAAAEEQLALALQIQPDFPEGIFEQGVLALARGDAEEAAERFREAILRHPDLIDAHYELALLYKEAGDIGAATEHFAETVRIEPDFADGHSRLALAALDRRDTAAAREHIEEAIRLLPDSPDVLHDLGIVLRAAEDVPGSAAAFEKAFRLRPDFAEAHYELGILRRDHGDMESAAREFGRALRLRPDFEKARHELDLALGAPVDPAATDPQ